MLIVNIKNIVSKILINENIIIWNFIVGSSERCYTLNNSVLCESY